MTLHQLFFFLFSQLLQLGSGCSNGFVNDVLSEKPTKGILLY